MKYFALFIGNFSNNELFSGVHALCWLDSLLMCHVWRLNRKKRAGFLFSSRCTFFPLPASFNFHSSFNWKIDWLQKPRFSATIQYRDTKICWYFFLIFEALFSINLSPWNFISICWVKFMGLTKTCLSHTMCPNVTLYR